MAGAAALVALGASRAGAGLVTVCVPEAIYPIVASQCPAEVMVRPVASQREATERNADVFAVGPGLGETVSEELLDFLVSHEAPAVVDADALNALSRNLPLLERLPPRRLLTPHPGELARLSDRRGGRVDLTRELADQWGVTLLHKGSRTAIASPDRPVELNTTGHPVWPAAAWATC